MGGTRFLEGSNKEKKPMHYWLMTSAIAANESWLAAIHSLQMQTLWLTTHKQ
jgi:hypothetical protein